MKGQGGGGYDYKRVTRGTLALLEVFCALTMVVDTQTCVCDEIEWDSYRHA